MRGFFFAAGHRGNIALNPGGERRPRGVAGGAANAPNGRMIRPPSRARWGESWALRRDFMRLLLLAVLLPVLVISALALWQEAVDRRRQAGQRLLSLAEVTAHEVDAYLQVHLAALQVLAARRSTEGSTDDAAAWATDLARLHRYYPGFSSLLVTDAEGWLRHTLPAAPGPPTRRSVADRSYFREPARTGRAHVSDAFRGRTLSSDPLIAVAAPLRPGGRFDGVLEGSIRGDTFAAIPGQPLHERGYEALLLDRRGAVIHATAGLPYRSLDVLAGTPGDRQLLAIAHAAEAKPRFVTSVLRDGDDAYALSVPLESGWRLLLMMPKDILDAELRRATIATLALLVVVLGGVLWIAALQMRRLLRNLGELLERMQRFALEQDPVPVPTERMPEELVPLVDALNHLGARASSAYRAVSRSLTEQERLRESLERVLAEREQEIAQRTEELRHAVAELDRLSRTDPLTGCLNRRGLDDAWAGLCTAERALAAPGVLALDIDHFKAYNDRYGHLAGDAVLKRVAGAIRSVLHDQRDLLARIGGEEFLVLLPEADPTQSWAVGERIRVAVRTASILHEDAADGVVTVSIGVATAVATDGGCLEPVLQRADEALYRAKHAGRDRVAG